MNSPLASRSASIIPKAWRLRIATAETIPLVVGPFQTYNNKTRSWASHTVDEIGSFLNKAVVIFV